MRSERGGLDRRAILLGAIAAFYEQVVKRISGNVSV